MADLTSKSDPELIALLSAGNEQAFAEIYQRYHHLLFLYTYKKLGDPEEAKDCIQEIFINLWNNRNTLTIKTSLASYLYIAARNKAFDLFAHKKVAARYLSSLQQMLQEPVISTDHLLREKEIQALINKEIAALPPRMREVFELSRREQLSHRDIAAKLHIAEDTVTSQIKKALKLLRVKLGLFTWVLLFLHR